MVTMFDSEDIEEEYLTCYICYDVFTEPKTLGCLHRFCERCLQGYLMGLGDIGRKKSFPCPVCREQCPAPNPRRPPADWAALLKTDFHLKNLIKALQSRNDKRGGRGQGRGVHPCSVHADKEEDLYCVDCEASICHLCAGISHRGCSNVITLTDAAADRRATFHIQQRQLSERLVHVQQLRVEIDSALEDLARQRNQAESSIREASAAAIALVRRRETDQVEELARRFETLRGAVAKRLLNMDRQISACEQVLETAAAKVASASDVDVMRSVANVLREEALDVDLTKIQNFVNRLQSVRLEFHPSHSLKIHLGEVVVAVDDGEEHQEISAKKPATTTTTHTNTTSSTPPPTRPQVPPKRHRAQTLATMETNVDGQPVKLRTIPGQFREDQVPPKLRDILVMGTTDKVVLTTDWANECVKAFHKRRERDSRLAVGGKPWCLARISDTQAAVSLPVSRQICLLKVLPRLTLQSSFFAQKRYSGLAALNPDTLVASGGGDPPCVDIISLGGDVLRSFSQDAATGRHLFSYPGYITTTPNRQNFLVSDRHRSAVICMNTSGHVIYAFRPVGGKCLREPSGVRTDPQGRVYVAESRGVVRLTPQGTLDRALLRAQDGVEDPRGLALDGDEGLLYVTSGEESIAVFRLS